MSGPGDKHPADARPRSTAAGAHVPTPGKRWGRPEIHDRPRYMGDTSWPASHPAKAPPQTSASRDVDRSPDPSQARQARASSTQEGAWQHHAQAQRPTCATGAASSPKPGQTDSLTAPDTTGTHAVLSWTTTRHSYPTALRQTTSSSTATAEQTMSTTCVFYAEHRTSNATSARRHPSPRPTRSRRHERGNQGGCDGQHPQGPSPPPRPRGRHP